MPSVDGLRRESQDEPVTTPFDDPQAELAWMFLQNLTADGDLDEGFGLLSAGFTYWNNTTGLTSDRTEYRRIAGQLRDTVRPEFGLVRCVDDGLTVVIEAHADGTAPDGTPFDAPVAYFFETQDGLITSLREYGDPRLVHIP